MNKAILFFLMIANVLTAQTEQWRIYEITLKANATGNPFKDVTLSATFNNGKRQYKVVGFYDGNQTYKIRFSPDSVGTWQYVTASNIKALDNQKGQFKCIPPSVKNHGSVRVVDTFHFAYADGTRYYPFGTTCYNWTNQPDSLQEVTLKTLATAPFNKIRMCVLPKYYDWNHVEPPVYPYEGDRKTKKWDFSRPIPLFFQNLEKRIAQLDALGIECDLIIFHPYDNKTWDFDKTTDDQDDFYLRYLIARLSAYKNIWWSLANEYDLMRGKELSDWVRFLKILKEEDPYQHLRSNHNWNTLFPDDPNLTHVSAQIVDDKAQLFDIKAIRDKYKKPALWDECKYEGNIQYHWGDITAERLTFLFWEAVTKGGYATHGETYMHPNDVLWWGKGGSLYGKSPERIGFLRKILEASPQKPLVPYHADQTWWNTSRGLKTEDNAYFLIYFGDVQPSEKKLKFPDNARYSVELIDTWNMTRQPLEGVFEPKFILKLPSKPYMAAIVKRL
jgi:hypothetical protein